MSNIDILMEINYTDYPITFPRASNLNIKEFLE